MSCKSYCKAAKTLITILNEDVKQLTKSGETDSKKKLKYVAEGYAYLVESLDGMKDELAKVKVVSL